MRRKRIPWCPFRHSPSFPSLSLGRLTVSHAACCTACHGVFATPKPVGAKIGFAMKVARHSPSAMWAESGASRRWPASGDRDDQSASGIHTLTFRTSRICDSTQNGADDSHVPTVSANRRPKISAAVASAVFL